MKPKSVELWERISSFSPDKAGAQLPFSRRLAKENGWPADFAARAIEEYKRFVYLAMAAGHPVSPSDAVDQVWHLHLTYTENYWKQFCAEILREPLHHQPTEGGPAEHDKFKDWYRRTKASYRDHFGEEPPRELWPGPDETKHHRVTKVDRATHWIIPKPRLTQSVLSLLLAAAAAWLAGCGAILGRGT